MQQPRDLRSISSAVNAKQRGARWQMYRAINLAITDYYAPQHGPTIDEPYRTDIIVTLQRRAQK